MTLAGVIVTVQVGAAATRHGAHGRGPQDPLGWLVVLAATGVVVLVFGLCARYFLKPGETSPDHIKRRILE